MQTPLLPQREFFRRRITVLLSPDLTVIFLDGLKQLVMTVARMSSASLTKDLHRRANTARKPRAISTFWRNPMTQSRKLSSRLQAHCVARCFLDPLDTVLDRLADCFARASSVKMSMPLVPRVPPDRYQRHVAQKAYRAAMVPTARKAIGPKNNADPGDRTCAEELR